MVERSSSTPGTKSKLYLVSLGCDKNLVDSEKALGLLVKAGYEYTATPRDADIMIVNTCCFIRDALEESIDTLIEMEQIKLSSSGRKPRLIVMGCMGERYAREIADEFPAVDMILGTEAWQHIADLVGESPRTGGDIYGDLSAGERILTTGGHYAYLKIAEGCDRYCTYCAIPYMRGHYRSVPMDELCGEAEGLCRGGVRELILVAQETTLYGNDLYGRKSLPGLLERLNGIDGLKWIRLLYCYPEEIDDELIEAVSGLDKVVKYLDIPIQSASDHILRRMGRRTRVGELRELIYKLRERIPGVALRTTLITGFPGETARDHEETLSFVSDMRFERLGVFEYSREEGTPAAAYGHQVSARHKAACRDEIMSLQRQISLEIHSSLVGRTLELMIEGRLPDESADGRDVYVARSYMDAPDIDGLVYLYGDGRELISGDFLRARITGASHYDLLAGIV